jgi:hypothetical protein
MSNLSLLPLVYAVYATASLVLTIVLARILFRHGEVLLKDVFADHPELARAVNQLLVVGFYLVNFGYALVMLRGGHAHDAVTAIETLANKLGTLLLSLALMHFVNLFFFHRMRRRAQLADMPPPVHQHGYLPQGQAA